MKQLISNVVNGPPIRQVSLALSLLCPSVELYLFFGIRFLCFCIQQSFYLRQYSGHSSYSPTTCLLKCTFSPLLQPLKHDNLSAPVLSCFPCNVYWPQPPDCLQISLSLVLNSTLQSPSTLILLFSKYLSAYYVQFTFSQHPNIGGVSD